MSLNDQHYFANFVMAWRGALGLLPREEPAPRSKELCPCGQPLHYSSAFARRTVQAIIDSQGSLVRVNLSQCSYLVPRHFVALHGLDREELPELAEQYGWQEVSAR